MRAIGLMSGTSMDGIDVAAIETDGETVTRFGPSALHFYQEHEVAILRRAMEAAPALRARTERPGVIAEAEKISTALHASAVNTFLTVNGIDRASIDVIGYHGQTVLHRPSEKLTVQLGDGAALARETGIPVVYDFRAADVAAGGQGAPLVPVLHRALTRTLDRPHPIVVLNLGGVANITFIDGENDPIACDTGPANALIDDFMRSRNGAARDVDGAAAAKGRVDTAAIDAAAEASVLCAALPEVARPQRFPRMGRGACRARRKIDRGRRRDADDAHRRDGRAHRRCAAARAAKLDRGGRRRAQSDAGADADGAARRGASRDRGSGRLVDRCARGAGLRVSRRALAERPAADVPDDDRRAQSRCRAACW